MNKIWSVLFLVIVTIPLKADDFGISIFKESIQQNENIVLSPISLSYGFALLSIGAKGETSNEITRAFNVDETKHLFYSDFSLILDRLSKLSKAGYVQLLIASALWLCKDYEVSKDFSAKATVLLNSNIYHVDFSKPDIACNTINDWVSEKTQNKFTSIIAPSETLSNSNIIITDAIYFKGTWKSTFEKESTIKRKFYVNGIKPVKVPTMYEQTYYNYFENDKIQVLEMKYLEENLSMLFILPKNKTDLPKSEKMLCRDSLLNWYYHLNEIKVEAYIPRFIFSSTTEMNQNLQNIGIKTVFDINKSDLSGICKPDAPLYISSVRQMTSIEVNEEGTEASAVGLLIGSLMESDSIPPVPIFRADHPFIFLIIDKSIEIPLFIGRVSNPLEH